MTPITDMVRKLFEKGVDHDAILIAIEAAEQAMTTIVSTRHPPDNPVDEAAERRRAWDREYRRKLRSSTRQTPTSTRHPPDSVDAPLSKERKNEGSKEEREARVPAVHPTRGHRLPEGWFPEQLDWATALGRLGDVRARGELEKFRDHWKQQAGARGVKLDWSAAWRNWVRRAAEYGGQNGKATRTGSVIDAWDRLKAKANGLDSDTGQDAFEFVPPRPVS
jgi:hypothetical protein